MHILVMGGSQFVSKSLALHLINKGYHVDIFTRGKIGVDFIGFQDHLVGDRNSRDQIKQLLKDKKYEYVFDISAYTRLQVETLLENIDTSLLKRYVFCSSGSVYSESGLVMTEDDPRGLNRHWGQYGLDKKETEDFLFQTEDIPFTIFRPSYIYGEGNNLYREAYVFHRFERHEGIPIPKGDCRVQFVHIKDVVLAMESVIGHSKSNREAYNITYPDFISWEKFINTAMDVTNQRTAIVEIDETILKDRSITTREYFPFRNVTYLLDGSKMHHHKLYNPQINLYDGLSKAYSFYKGLNQRLSDKKMSKIKEVLEIHYSLTKKI
jgi:nucleoside-diphosphate-sugar epimerase